MTKARQAVQPSDQIACNPLIEGLYPHSTLTLSAGPCVCRVVVLAVSNSSRPYGWGK
jgi:hypothetical protein